MSFINGLRKNSPRPLKRILSKYLDDFKFLYYHTKASVFPSMRVYHCSCCDLWFNKFVKGGFEKHPTFYNLERFLHGRQDVVCPFCGSAPRHRIQVYWCEQNLNILKQSSILYFAMEKGTALWFRKHKIRVTTADLYTNADLKLDLNCIAQPNNSWDIIFCNHVLEHVQDYHKALAELYRILMPGGMLLCSFPIDESLSTVYEDKELYNLYGEGLYQKRLQKFGQKDHLRIFGKDSKSLLVEAGFVVSVVDGNLMPVEILPVVGPADYDSNIIFVCVKPVLKREATIY